MLQKKQISDYLRTFTAITDLCTVYPGVPKTNNIPQDTYIYPSLILDDQEQFSLKSGETMRSVSIRINVVVKSTMGSGEYAEGVAYEVFDAIDNSIIIKLGSIYREVGGIEVVSIEKDELTANGYISDREIYTKGYTFIYRV